MPLLSVIVPVYNTVDYLDRCITSILSQTLKDLELILVDDGSTDGSERLCDEYARRDNRVRVVHQVNGGVSAARNTALDVVKGKYLGFVDSDDTIEHVMYEVVIEAMERTQSDIGICNSIRINENGKVIETVFVLSNCMINRETMMQMSLCSPPKYGNCVCNKVFVRNKIEDVRFPIDVSVGEDALYLHHCIIRIKKAVIISDPLYLVLERAGSATRTSPSRYMSILSVDSQIADSIKVYMPQLYHKAFAKYIDDCIWIMRALRVDPSKNAVDIGTIRSALRKNTLNIIRCIELGWKQKLTYIMSAI